MVLKVQTGLHKRNSKKRREGQKKIKTDCNNQCFIVAVSREGKCALLSSKISATVILNRVSNKEGVAYKSTYWMLTTKNISKNAF